MKDTPDIARMKKIIWILFATVIVFVILSIIFDRLSQTFLIYFSLLFITLPYLAIGCSIAIIVYSIKLIRRKQLKFGIPFLVISALAITYFFLRAFLIIVFLLSEI